MASLVRYHEPYDRQTREYVTSGRVRFDPAQAQRCLDDMAQHCATEYVWWQCYGVFTGTVAPSAVCEMNVECAPGTYCDHGGPDRFTCPGRCVAAASAPGMRPALAGSCRADPGAVAFHNGQNCVSARFGAPAAVGEACDEVDEGDGRVRLTRCADGLACSHDSPLSGEGRCVRVRVRGDGEACAAGDFCPGGQRCSATATAPGRCAPYGPTHVAGGPCTPPGAATDDRVFCDPLAQLECGDDGRCVRVGDGSEGSRCVGSSVTEGLCNPGLYCDGATRTCQPQLPDGAPCGSTPTKCRSGVCRGAVCVARLCG